jgi:hypothetical protein
VQLPAMIRTTDFEARAPPSKVIETLPSRIALGEAPRTRSCRLMAFTIISMHRPKKLSKHSNRLQSCLSRRSNAANFVHRIKRIIIAKELISLYILPRQRFNRDHSPGASSAM